MKEHRWKQPRRAFPGSEIFPSEEIPWRATAAGLWMDEEPIGFAEAGREILRLAEENKTLREVRDLFAKGPDALEKAVLARVRRELLSWVTANTWVGRPDEFPQGVLDKGRFLIAMDSICPEE